MSKAIGDVAKSPLADVAMSPIALGDVAESSLGHVAMSVALATSGGDVTYPIGDIATSP